MDRFLASEAHIDDTIDKTVLAWAILAASQ